MNRFLTGLVLCSVAVVGGAASLRAQAAPAQAPPAQTTPAQPTTPPPQGGQALPIIEGFKQQDSQTFECPSRTHCIFYGDVEVEITDTKFFADKLEVFTDLNVLHAEGNVLVTTANSRIAADRIDFNTKTRLGTFYNASGMAAVTPSGGSKNKSAFGTQEPDIYFHGEILEKLEDRKYRLTKGVFTTCVQPTPRWQLTSSSVTLNLDHYAFLKNTVLKVKDVPLFYLPVMYYPIKEDDRSTGFLIPTYGTSTIQGQKISNAFFWAINRSHDATFLYDWFSQTGQGVGSEYRYILGPSSSGNARFYTLREQPIQYTTPGSTTLISRPGKSSFSINGSGTQALGRGLNARASADYFSDITVQQTYHQNLADATQRRRSFGGSVNGSWGAYSMAATFDRQELFFGTTTSASSSAVTGNAPRVSFNRGEKPIPGTPLYASLGGEFVTMLRESITGDKTVDTGLTRTDFTPQVRFPFTRWPFLTLNSSMAFRYTYWSDSRDPINGVRLGESISRRYFDVQSRIVGPVLNRIWNTPNSGYAEKVKHTIEPYVNLQRVTAIDNYNSIVQLDERDSAIGSLTRFSYGVNNRIFAKVKQAGPGAPAGQSRQILNVSISQSYYTDAKAAQVDRDYGTSFSGTPPSHRSPVAIEATASPTNDINASFRTEYDTQFGAFRTFDASGRFERPGRFQTIAGWSQRRFVKGLAGFDNESSLTHYLNSQTTVTTDRNRVGAVFSFNYDLTRGTFLQRRYTGYYNAQCCGFAVEYQTFNYSALSIAAPVAVDNRFNVSFTLAGIGTFSNFFGALGGANR